MRISFMILKRAPCVMSLALAIGLAISVAVSNAQVNESDSVEQWIARLADPVPAVRNNAEREILAIGEDALPLVRQGLRNGNLEIHNRCRTLLEQLETRRKARLAKVFMEAASGDESLKQFPAWQVFEQFAEDQSIESRKLFLKMCDSIPLVFSDYDFKVEQTGPALKQAARLALVKGKHPSATADVLLVAYLFLSDRASKSNESSSEPLFDSVEILEGLNFISNSEHAQVVRQSDFRIVVDAVVARWIKSQGENREIPDSTMFSLVYETTNPLLIDDLVRNYDSFDNSMKLNFIDIVSRAVAGKKGAGFDRCIEWFAKTIEDESTVLNSRFQKRPAEKIAVTPKLLAETVLAEILNKDLQSGEKIEFEKIFGIYPRSGKVFLIIKSEKGRQLLSDKLRVRIKPSEPVD